MFPWSDEEVEQMIAAAPRTQASAQFLSPNADDVSLHAPDEDELYRLIKVALLDHIGWVLFVRVYPESSPVHSYHNEADPVKTRWYVRLQFCKREELKVI